MLVVKRRAAHVNVCVLVFMSLFALLPTAVAAEKNPVGFDVPAIVVAQQVDPGLAQTPMVGGKLIRLKLPVSTFVSTRFQGRVSEYVVEFESPNQSMRVVDFWPRDEAYTDIEGSIAVQSSEQTDRSVSFDVSGGFEPFVRGKAGGNYGKKSSQSETYQRRPQLQTLTSSGTIRRGYGVFFKFRPGPIPSLEGSRDIAILAEVPSNWRADMMIVSMRAVGDSATGLGKQELGSSRLWMTVHQEGDLAAAARTRRFVTQERSLRALAAASREEIKDKSLPSIWHKVGAAFDVVEPRIPDDYLAQVLFGPPNQYFEGDSHRLPVDLRVAILDFWDDRKALTNLAFGVDQADTDVHVSSFR